MTAFLIIIGVLILVILSLLLLKISVSFSLKAEEEVIPQLYISGKKINLQKKKENKKRTGKKTNLYKLVKLLFSEEIGIFSKIKYLLKKTVIKKLNLHITVAGEDAAKTAIEYGSVCAVLYPVVAFLETIITVKKDDIKIECDYENKTPKIYLFINLKIRIITLLILVLKLLPTIKKFTNEVKDNE